VELGARLGADCGRDPAHERLVEGGGQADGLGEHGGDPLVGHAVQRLAPPVVGGDLQARDRGRRAAELGGLLVVRHARDEIVDALVDRQRRVQVRGAFALLGRGRAGWYGEQQKEQDGELLGHGCTHLPV
jgi:hypothetical protein